MTTTATETPRRWIATCKGRVRTAPGTAPCGPSGYADCGTVNAWNGSFSTRCRNCDSIVTARTPIKVTIRPEKACDAKCYNAKTAGCTCSCEGDHHGKAHEGHGILS